MPKIIGIMLVFVIASTVFAQEERNPPVDFQTFPILYELEGTEDVQVIQDIPYQADEADLIMDIYLPVEGEETETYPLVIIALPTVPVPEALLLDWEVFISWGRLIGASGMAAALIQYGEDPVIGLQHTETALAYLEAHAETYHLDLERVCYMGFSAFTPVNFTMAVQHQADCIVSYYGLMQFPDDPALSPLIQIENNDPADVPPLLLVNPLQDEHVTMPRWLREFVAVAQEREINMIYVEHPEGEHIFEVMDDNDITREIIAQTLTFLQEYLQITAP